MMESGKKGKGELAMLRFSIIIPAYNVKQYLDDCLSIISDQDFDSYEVIIVNDGSTDGTKEYLDSLSEPRFKVIHKENGGLSSARNCGLDVAAGEYILFLDSDDFWIYTNTLSEIDKSIKKYDADCIIFRNIKCKSKSDTKYGTKIDKAYIPKINLDLIIKQRIYKACSWDKVVKRSIIEKNNMRFPDGKLAEDIFWCASLLDYCSSFIVLDCPLYAYRVRSNSITHDTVRMRQRFKARIEESRRSYNSFNSLKVRAYVANEYACAYRIIPKDISYEEYMVLKNDSYILSSSNNIKAKIIYYYSKIANYSMIKLLCSK